MAEVITAPVSPQWDFIDALGDGVYGVDRDGRCTFVNAAALRMLGYAVPADLIGRNMHATIHHTRPDGSAFPQAGLPTAAYRDQWAPPCGCKMRCCGGATARRSSRNTPPSPCSRRGAITGSVITFTDTSVRQDAQKRLAVQYAISQILAGEGVDEDMPTLLLEAIGVGLAWGHRVVLAPRGRELGP